MVQVLNAEEQRREFVRMILQEDLDLQDVWLEYFAMSGSASEEDVALYAVEMVMLSEAQRDLLALAAQESAQNIGVAFHLRLEPFLRQLEDHGGDRNQNHDDCGGDDGHRRH
ncbi:hypothetical protein [Arthrobacter sp. NPDC092385]|uniref:hypothetical protein n=1 Tax=Arthrobacter sp. NPDC092385 TaxID=3363943 RepID=UPI003830FA0B